MGLWETVLGIISACSLSILYLTLRFYEGKTIQCLLSFL